jgi:glycosyltransferase involved in cell wall biosynthesis
MMTFGGGGRVCASLIEALNTKNIQPDLYLTAPVSNTELSRVYGKSLRFTSKYLLPFKIPALGIYQKLLNSFIIHRLKKYNVVVDTTGASTPFYFTKMLKRYILYIYNPLATLFQLEETSKYSSGLFWKVYFQPYRAWIKQAIKHVGEGAEIICVSEFTRQRVEKYWKQKGVTIYPPVDTETLRCRCNSKTMGRDGVISVGRFTPEKRQLDQLKIAEQLPDVEFRICGNAKTPYYQQWFNHLQRIAFTENMRNVKFYPDIPLKTLKILIWRSKVFLHTMHNEDLGLTPLECAIGGCIPVVHNTGGCKEGVPFKELRFNELDEAVRAIKDCLIGRYDYLLPRLQEHILANFSENNFQEKMLEVIFNG